MLSSEVADAETIVRVVKSPYHLTKNRSRLTKKVFQPPKGEAEFSVIRQEMTDDYCKDVGVTLVGTGGQYEGLATGLVGFIRSVHGNVVDKPDEFAGHAHVVNIHPHAAQNSSGEAIPSKLLAELDLYYTDLLRHFLYHPDPKPLDNGWTGQPLGRTPTNP